MNEEEKIFPILPVLFFSLIALLIIITGYEIATISTCTVTITDVVGQASRHGTIYETPHGKFIGVYSYYEGETIKMAGDFCDKVNNE
jgi:hypothetical protein